MWGKILKQTADDGVPNPVYGDLAFRGLRLEREIREFHYPEFRELSSADADLVRIVHSARAEEEAFQIWKRSQETKGD